MNLFFLGTGVELIRSPTGPVIKGTPLSISCRGKKLESATDSMEFSWQWIHNGEIFKLNQSSSLPGKNLYIIIIVKNDFSNNS